MFNRIKQIICFSVIGLSTFAMARASTIDTHDYQSAFSCQEQYEGNVSYRYFTFGMGPVFLIPNAGIGYRSRLQHHGFDLSLSASTAIIAHSIQGNLLYHFYPNDRVKDPLYIGAGISTSLYFGNHQGTSMGVSPDFVIGKEFCSRENAKSFVEVHVSAPNWMTHSARKSGLQRIDFPLMFIKYGVAF